MTSENYVQPWKVFHIKLWNAILAESRDFIMNGPSII